MRHLASLGFFFFQALAGSAQTLVPNHAQPFPLRGDSVRASGAAPRPDSVTVRASSRYEAGRAKQRLLGRNYRREWAQPVRVPVLNMATDRGGLEPLKQGGGFQTKSLRLRAADGTEYVLRSVDKNTDAVLDAELRQTLAADVVQDQISASHPYAALTVPVLAEAAGVGHTNPRLVWVPDDARLGPFRPAFAQTLDLFEEREPAPPASFGGPPTKEHGTEKVLQLLRENARYRVDEVNLLRARLLDLLIGDWDRHDDQWRWLVYPQADGSRLLRAVPRDRDQTYFVNQGVVPKIASREWLLPKLQGFDASVRNVNSFMFNARFFDRSFLTGLSRADWLAVAAQVQATLPDSVLERAVRRMPPAVFPFSGPTILAALKARRQALPAYAAQYYAFLARQVSITGTDQAERFLVEHAGNGEVRVRLYSLGPDTSGRGPALRYDRRFYPQETKEIRLYALGGTDVVTVRGQGRQRLRVRIIGGEGPDTVTDSARLAPGGARTLVYDTPTGNELQLGPRTRRRTANDTTVNAYNRQDYRYPYLGPVIPLAYNRDDGLFLGAGVEVRRPGFRKEPWAAVHRLQGNVALSTRAFSFGYEGTFARVLGPVDLLTSAQVQAPNYVRNFFGLGNESGFDQARGIAYYRVRFDNFSAQALARRRLGHQQFYAGPVYQTVQVQPTAGRYIAELPPGTGVEANRFDREHFLGAKLGYVLDRGNNPLAPSQGLRWRTEYQLLAGLGGAARPLSQLTSELTGYFSLPAVPGLTLAARVGGTLNFGSYEFFQAATLSGLDNLRGYRRTRFSGEDAVYNNVELRAQLGSFHSWLLAGRYGALAFHDVGRVWQDGENSRVWHTGYGGGLWLAPFSKVVVAAMWGFSREESLPLARLGFLF